MYRVVVLSLTLLLTAGTAKAVDAPAGQAIIDAQKVLRGSFVEDHQTNTSQNPVHTSGYFVVAPSHGLIWNILKPFPTSTIVTAQGAVQDLGGLIIKLPTKNLGHLYNMVGGALAGNWATLEEDFVITKTSNGDHWQMLLTPRPDATHKLPYSTITISGGRFVENIVLMNTNGTSDVFSFSNAILTAAPPQSQEIAAFQKVMH